MFLRTLSFLALVSLPFLSGCGSYICREAHPAPAFKVCNGPRLTTELGWLYANIQHGIFGVNYYADIEAEFPSNPYE